MVAVVSPRRFCVTPSPTSTTAPTKLIGTRIRSVPRTRSTQKLPSVRPCRRAKPRMIATAMAMPAAADTKFCTVNAVICDRWLIACSPENHCQLVLVVKLTAALNAPNGATAMRSVGLSGRDPWTRRIR